MANISENKAETKTLKDKKILYLVTQTKWGGAQQYVLDLVREMAKDNEVTVACGQTDENDTKFVDSCKKLGIKVITVPYLVRKIDLGKDYLSVIDLYKLLMKGQYDLIHLNSSKVGLLASIASKLYSANPINTKLRIVYTAHGFVFNEPLSKFRKKLYKFSETVSTSIQHLVIAVSEADKQSAVDNKVVDPRKIFTVHNGIDAEKYTFLTKEEAKQKLRLDNKKYFGTIASFYKTKGHEYLIDAIKLFKQENSPLLKEYGWTLMGDGPELDKIRQLAKEKEVDQYIKFIPHQENGWQYLKAFDCFILPSVKEGLPYALLEAGLARLPVIASNVGGIGEIIKDKETGLLSTPANPLALVEDMKTLTSAPDLVEKLVENNYQNIKNNFSLQKTLAKTKELYLKLF